MSRKVYCGCDSDFSSHYRTQAGRGFEDINVFRGQPYQRGYGIGSIFKRFGIPVLKFFGKELLKTGMNIGQDILDQKNVKQSLVNRGKEGIRTAAKRGLMQISNEFDQSGSGLSLSKKKRRKIKRRKRKVTAKSKKAKSNKKVLRRKKVGKGRKRKRKPKDIFA
uniref:Uncharacterized protein n=1 Tax=Tetranychus urticae TaxID=32264 RepID=A0A158P4S7_TETUR